MFDYTNLAKQSQYITVLLRNVPFLSFQFVFDGNLN